MAKDGVKVLFVDYLQLVKVPGKESKREEVAEVSTALKSIARELKITVVALAQLSRDADDRRPSMGNVQHSSQVEQDADQVWLIWHKKSDVTTPEGEPEKGRSFIILDKVRDGETGDVEVTFERSTANFYEVVREDNRGE
jgi:replicative DNA helicase